VIVQGPDVCTSPVGPALGVYLIQDNKAYELHKKLGAAESEESSGEKDGFC
jgi:hypothetical protein